MTDAVSDIEFLKREIEERDQTIDRLTRDLENADYERPEVVAQILEHSLRSWPRARWQALADLIRPSSI